MIRCARLWGVIVLIALSGLGTASAQTATTVPPTAAPLTVAGNVTSGTADVTLPADLHLTLHLIRTGPATPSSKRADLVEAVTRDTTVDNHSAFRFESVPALPGDLCVITTDYAGITQGSTPVTIGDGQTTLDLPITVFAATHDPAVLHISKTQQLLSFTAGNLMRVLETVDFVNTGNRYYLSDKTLPDGTPLSVSLPLPIGARGIAFNTAPTTRFTVSGDPNAPIVQDSKAVIPGQIDEIIFSYELPYDQGAPIDRDYPYTTDALQVLLPAEANIALTGAIHFSASQNLTIDKQRPFTQYSLDAPIKAGGRLIYTLSGAPHVLSTPNGTDSGINLGTVLVIVVMLIVIGLIVLFIVRGLISRRLGP